jgi:precorrin-2/cobalt-factor-2 C20-methyltransferase
MSSACRFLVIGVGPGDPELMTLKAVRRLGECGVVAGFAKRGRAGHAFRIAGAHIPAGCERLRFEYPYTTEIDAHESAYGAAMAAFYDNAAALLAVRLDRGLTVGLICEGDPLFYGSAMHLFERLRFYPAEIIAGVTGMAGAAAAALLPMAQGNDSFTILPATLPEAVLVTRLIEGEAVVIMKTGRNLAKIRRALAQAGRLAQAVYVERATMAGQRVLPLTELVDPAPYFSIILVPGWAGR